MREGRSVLWIARVACALALLLVTAAIAGAGVASSHSSLVGSKPDNGAVLRESPETVEARFEEPLHDNGRNLLTVIAVDGTRVDRDEPWLSPDRTTISTRLVDDLARGAYRAEWRSSSIDGHVDQGSFGFTVDPNAPAGGGGRSAVALVAALLIIAAVSAGGLVWLRRRRSHAVA